MGPRNTTWRCAAVVAALVMALVAPGLSGTAGAQAKRTEDLSGGWTAQDGTPWTFTGDGQGGYTGEYHGTATHSKLVGIVTATFDGSTLDGTVHIQEPNQVEGGPPTIVDGTASFAFSRRTLAVLKGELVTPTGAYPFTLTCQSGPCEEPPCSFVRAGDQEATKQEAAIYDDLDFLLSTAFPGNECAVEIRNGALGVTGTLSADALSKNLDKTLRSLERAFPDAPVAVRKSIAKAVVVAEVLSAIDAKGQPVFPGVRSLVDGPAFALVAGAALKPPGDAKAADALRTLIRVVALRDAVASAPTP
ncbi:MAG: hypothetical protein WD598_12115 [Acidimicrobiia bacterium]